MTKRGELVKMLLEDRKRWEAESAKREADLIAERARHEKEMAEERDRREADHLKQMERLCEQMEMMRKLADKVSSGTGVREETADVLKLTKLTGAEDIEAYLKTFERMMEVYGVKEDRWAFKLAPQLTGKAQQAYAAMTGDEATDYKAVKKAILQRYNISPETYRTRFRSEGKRTGKDTWTSAFVCRTG